MKLFSPAWSTYIPFLLLYWQTHYYTLLSTFFQIAAILSLIYLLHPYHSHGSILYGTDYFISACHPFQYYSPYYFSQLSNFILFRPYLLRGEYIKCVFRAIIFELQVLCFNMIKYVSGVLFKISGNFCIRKCLEKHERGLRRGESGRASGVMEQF